MDTKIIAAAILGLVLVTSGCMDSTTDQQDMPEEPDENISAETDNAESDDASEVDRTIEVSGGNYYFEPENIEVEQGQTIEFVFRNEGGQHDMRIPDLGQGTSVISGGETESFTVTFDETGEIEFICSVGTHAAQGMTGIITIS
ncbi:MAG: plastocyanin/azurin family copper-binding protein [Candidatus Nanohaloarchaea archaeon]